MPEAAPPAPARVPFPRKIAIYPATDNEGEPRVKAAWKLWPAPSTGSPSREIEAGGATGGHRGLPEATALAVRDVPVKTSQQEFLDEVDESGFAGLYDFAYVPVNFDDGIGKGAAFINLVTPQAAAAFEAAWHLSERLGAKQNGARALNVAPARMQGAAANLRKCSAGGWARVKNPNFHQFVRQ